MHGHVHGASSSNLLHPIGGRSLILQNPENMGYAAVKAMHEHLTGKSPAKTIDTGCVVMTKENAETPEVKALRPAAK